MNGILILLVVVAITLLLGKYAISEGYRIEERKKFMKNMNDFENKRK